MSAIGIVHARTLGQIGQVGKSDVVSLAYLFKGSFHILGKSIDVLITVSVGKVTAASGQGYKKFMGLTASELGPLIRADQLTVTRVDTTTL